MRSLTPTASVRFVVHKCTVFSHSNSPYFSIREAAGSSVKSSVSHSWSYDTRDDKATPSRGFLFRTFQVRCYFPGRDSIERAFAAPQELAGLSGDVSFLKSHYHLQLSHSLFQGSVGGLWLLVQYPLIVVFVPTQTISFAAKTGLLYPLRKSSHPPSFSDRFQLGGPLDVRLFKECGLGPREKSECSAEVLAPLSNLLLIAFYCR